jgi:hypothetical protein
MQVEEVQQVGEQLARQAILAEAVYPAAPAMQSEVRLPGAVASTCPQDSEPASNVMRGLAMALPLSLSLWMAIGFVVWVMTR